MRIYFTPCAVDWHFTGQVDYNGLVFLHRVGEKPRVFMHHANTSITTRSFITPGESERFCVYGEFVDGQSMGDLQENDTLFITAGDFEPFFLDMHVVGDMLVPFEREQSVLDIAAGMEKAPEVYIASREVESILNNAFEVKKKARELYEIYPAYQHIMLKKDGKIKSMSIVELAAAQEEEKQKTLLALFLSMSTIFKTHMAVAARILEWCEYDEELMLPTQEEQVGAFIEFSRTASKQKKEYVTDSLIDAIANSPEYEQTKNRLSANNLGISKTQQFNVFQQVGFFSSPRRGGNIMYNLSDMGAGKTLMTVEAIYLLDLKQMSTWKNVAENIPDNIEVCEICLPDKHIITPTLSVKSSWIDTFRLFYEVKVIDDMTYELSVTYDGMTAKSMVHVSPFTVKDGKIFAGEKLPYAKDGTYLIIDEIHQLVNRNVAKTKFFPPKTMPIETYKIFVLSGTLSNMKTAQWFNFMRFMGLKPVDSGSPAEAGRNATQITEQCYDHIQKAAENLRSDQHRYFDTEPINSKNYYCHRRQKKQTSIEQEFYGRYGSHIISPHFYQDRTEDVEDLLTHVKNRAYLETDSDEIDNINFELFYKIVGSKAVTAQSMQVAEELFGEQKKQHVSDIIKTVSPLSKDDIQILKILHHIAEDHAKYKSQTIAKAINNAILNLNDGLQTKNIYDIVSGFADKNIRFFEYLASLDVNILEKLPESGLIKMPKLEDTDKFKVLKDILQREKDETHLIVVNDFYALSKLSDALGIERITKEQLKRELDYQEVLDGLFEKQSIVIVTQDMIKSSLDLVQANRLIQYQLNTEISDIIQTQNRINRIGQTRETRGYYIASDQLQENLIELFLESYRNIRVAHKGIVELFTDITSQINIINDYLERAISAIENTDTEEPAELEDTDTQAGEMAKTQLVYKNDLPSQDSIVSENGISRAILFPQGNDVMVLVPLVSGSAFPLGRLDPEVVAAMGVEKPVSVFWNLETDMVQK